MPNSEYSIINRYTFHLHHLLQWLALTLKFQARIYTQSIHSIYSHIQYFNPPPTPSTCAASSLVLCWPISLLDLSMRLPNRDLYCQYRSLSALILYSIHSLCFLCNVHKITSTGTFYTTKESSSL